MNFNLDVQFGNWGDTGFNFSGGPGPEAGVTTNGTVAVSSGSTQPQPLTNHLGQSNQAVSESNSIMQSAQMQSAPQPPASMGSLPGAESPGGRLDAMNQPSAPSPHTNVFHTVTSASPKEYSQSSLSQSNKVSAHSVYFSPFLLLSHIFTYLKLSLTTTIVFCFLYRFPHNLDPFHLLLRRPSTKLVPMGLSEPVNKLVSQI